MRARWSWRRPSEPAEQDPPSHEPTQGLYGWITHTELASADPDATRQWCASVLRWTFMPGFPTPDGDYHLFAYSDKGGGGIRRNNPPETPGSIPYVHVPDARAAFERALQEGAEEMLSPTPVMHFSDGGGDDRHRPRTGWRAHRLLRPVATKGVAVCASSRRNTQDAGGMIPGVFCVAGLPCSLAADRAVPGGSFVCLLCHKRSVDMITAP